MLITFFECKNIKREEKSDESINQSENSISGLHSYNTMLAKPQHKIGYFLSAQKQYKYDI